MAKYTLFLYKNIVCPAQAEDFFFLPMLFSIFLDQSSWNLCLIFFDGVEAILDPECRQYSLISYRTSCSDVISIELAAVLFSLFFGVFCSLEGGRVLRGSI